MLWTEGWTCSEEVAAEAVTTSVADDYWNATYQNGLYSCSSSYLTMNGCMCVGMLLY